MQVTITGTPKEIAALVVGLQERQSADDLKAAMLGKTYSETVKVIPPNER